jgi:hypothetical protein
MIGLDHFGLEEEAPRNHYAGPRASLDEVSRRTNPRSSTQYGAASNISEISAAMHSIDPIYLFTSVLTITYSPSRARKK